MFFCKISFAFFAIRDATKGSLSLTLSSINPSFSFNAIVIRLVKFL